VAEVRVSCGDISLEVSDTGEGRPVVLLHGFPDTGRMWDRVVPGLVDAGFRCIVPDLRGYGGSDKPDDTGLYAIPFLAGDVLGLLDHLGLDKAHVVGHDWGSALAWATAAFAPERVDHLVAVSVGHPAAFGAAGFEQREKSWYMLLFQFEGIAERWLSDNDWANMRAWSKHPDLDGVIADLERGGNLTNALSWYRANLPPASLVEPPMAFPPVQAPTMGVWSTGDFALTETQMKASADQCANGFRYERLDGPGHWIPVEAADDLTRLLVDFLPA
jgi:pimeloyl-ACP methyl ester carboxylesterase